MNRLLPLLALLFLVSIPPSAFAQRFEKGWVDVNVGVATAAEDSYTSTRVLTISGEAGGASVAYSLPRGNVSEEQAFTALREFYANEPFVRVVDHLPGTKDSVDTNFCDITVRRVRDRLITVSCIDNLIKGAAGAAVQNLNLMCGFAETTALR